MASNVPPPMPGAPGAPAPKKTSPVVWVLAGCGVLVVLIAGALAIGGFFIAHKVKQAGIDPELLQKHPELAAVKMMVAMNPDAEIVSIDENRGVVSVRDKRTGKVVTMIFEDIKNGKLTFEEDGKKVSIQGQGEGDNASVTLNSSEGTASLGGVVKLPGWFPAYPGATPKGFSSQTAAGSQGGFAFKTGDSAEQVITFYENGLKSAGLTVDVTRHPAGGIVKADAGGRKVVINVTAEGGGSQINGTFEDQ
jgi:hypothetical protein